MNKPTHQVPIGSIVKVKVDLSYGVCSEDVKIDLAGDCQLYVVAHADNGSESTPLYVVSDLPVEYAADTEPHSQPRLLYRSLATLVEYFFEDAIEPTGQQQKLHSNLSEWIAKDAA